MKKRKLVLALMLSLMMLVTMIPSFSFADETGGTGSSAGSGAKSAATSGTCGATGNDHVTWKLTQNNSGAANPTYTLTIDGSGAMADYTVNDTGDDRPWKEYADSITNVEISESVTSIGNSAFRNLTALTTANIPASINKLGDHIYRGDTSLTTVSWAEGFKAPTITDTDSKDAEYSGTYVPTSMFDGCTSLGSGQELSAWLPKSFTGVGCAAFRGTQFNVNFDNWSNLNYIGAYAFSEMPNLDSFTLTDKITIGLRGTASNAFTKSGLKSLTVDVETVPNRFAFSANELAKIVLTDKVKNINTGAFHGTAITELVIPSGVEKLGEWSFLNCSSLKKLTLLGKITLEGVQFPGTPLEELVIGKDAVVTCTDNPFRGTGNYPAMTSLKKVSIFGTFTRNGEDTKTFWKCFSSNADLTEAVLSGKNVANFSQSAFPNVTTLSILGGEATFPGYTLGDSKLEKVTIDVEQYSSDSGSFRYAKNLKTFRLKANSATLDNRAFVECPSLMAVDLTECGSITYGDNTFGSMTTTGQNNAPTSHTATLYVNSTSANPKIADNKAGLSDSHGIVAVTNGGTFPENIDFTSNTLATPTKANYKFLGWYDNEDCTETAAVTTPIAGTTYYAKWKEKEAQELSFKENAVTVHANEKTVTNPINHTKGDGSVTYKSSDENVATVAENGKVTIVGAGTATIKATAAETDNYKEVSAKYTLTVTDHRLGDKWESDADKHWHACEICQTKVDSAEHEFQWVVGKEATTTEKGSKHEKCTVCGYEKKAVEIPVIENGTTGGDQNSGNAGNGTKADAANGSKTGDAMPIGMLAVLMLAAAAGIAFCGRKLYKSR